MAKTNAPKVVGTTKVKRVKPPKYWQGTNKQPSQNSLSKIITILLGG